MDVDAHGDWELRAIRAWYALERCCEKTDVRISSSGRGLHLIGWTTDDLDLDDRLRIRRWLADDQNRVRMDAERGGIGHTTDVLWSAKSGSGEADEDYTDLWDALDHITASEPPHRRLKRRVQDGLVV